MHVGVIPVYQDHMWSRVGIPHACGGDPVGQVSSGMMQSGIPHACGGDPFDSHNPAMIANVFPMHVGVIL